MSDLKNKISDIVYDEVDNFYLTPGTNFYLKNLQIYDNWKDSIIDKIIKLLEEEGLI